MDAVVPKKTEIPIPGRLILVFFTLAAGILAAGYSAYRGYENRHRVDIERQLSAIAELKIAQLQQWRSERLGDASTLQNNAVFSGLVKRHLAGPRDLRTGGMLQEWIGQYLRQYDYDQACLIDPRGVTILSSPPGRLPASAAVAGLVPDVVRSGRAAIVDFYRHDQDQRIYLSVLAPILDRADAGRVIAVVALRIDPGKFLYPFILHWPAPSRTAETLLVRREGTTVLYLNELKYIKDAALNHRISLERRDVPAVLAALGRTGIVQGMDYRGNVPVIADVRAVPDSPWFLVTRMDMAEAFAAVQKQLWLIVGFMIALITGAATGLFALWREQSVGFYQERYRAAALSASEAKYRLVVDHAGEAIVVIQDGMFRFFNTFLVARLGFPEQELEATPFLSFVHPDDRAMVAERHRQRMAGAEVPARYQFRVVAKNGGVLWVEVNVVGIEWNGRPAILALMVDITERRLAEEKLRRSELMLRGILDNLQDAYVRTDLEGRFVMVSPSAARLYGYDSAEAMIGLPAESLYEDQAARRAMFEELRKSGQVVDYTGRGRRMDGTTFWVSLNAQVFRDEQGNVAGTEGFIRDITERKSADAALRESEELFALFMRNSPIYTFIKTVTPTESRVLKASDNYLQMIGVAGTAMVGKTMAELFPPDFAAKMTADDWAVVSRGEVLRLDEELNGRSYTTIKFPVVQGSKTLLAGYTIDITERKNAEAALKHSLREKEVLLKEVHHRVKNNMQVIYSLLNLQAKGIADGAVRAMFEESRDRVNSMALIHEQLYRAEDLAHIDFKEYLEHLVQGIASTYRRPEIAASVEMESLALDVNVGIPCGLIVNELVSNSFKYAFPERRPGSIRVGMILNAAGCLLTVADDGVGFPADVDFRNTTSLGLQLVNVLAGQIHGTIELTRTGGSRFVIAFPGPSATGEQQDG